MDAINKREVAVSYSWKAEREGANAGAVDRFCQELRERGVNVMRDKDRLKHGDSIANFMRDVGQAPHLCVFVSDAYLKSANCMYEMLVAWQHNKDNSDAFRQRVKIWNMGDARIWSTGDRLTRYVAFWRSIVDEDEKLTNTHASKGLGPAELSQINRRKDIGNNINDILCFINDSLSPQGDDEFIEWVAGDEAKGTDTGVGNGGSVDDPASIGGDDPAVCDVDEIHQRLFCETKRLLTKRSKLKDFLQKTSPIMLEKGQDGWRLTSQWRKGVPDNVAKVLKEIKEALGSGEFAAESVADWDGLKEFVGVLAVLAVNPQWIAEQRRLMARECVEFPGKRDHIAIVNGRADFVELLKQALAEGFVRLDAIFGITDQDGGNEQAIPSPGLVSRAVSGVDRARAMKIHVISHVFKKEKFDEDDSEEVETLFSRVKEEMRCALEDHSPWLTKGEEYRDLAELIKKDLQMSDLLLILPKKRGREEEVMINAFSVLRHLNDIRQYIERGCASGPR